MIKGEKAFIRELTEDDFSLIKLWKNNVELQNETLGELNEFLLDNKESWFQFIKSRQDIKFFIIEDINGNSAGYLGFYNFDIVNGKTSIFLWIVDPRYKNKGIGSSALKTFVKYLFSTFRLKRIDITVPTDNLLGQKVLEKCGFSKEGLLRSYKYLNGKYKDFYIYSILYDEISL